MHIAIPLLLRQLRPPTLSLRVSLLSREGKKVLALDPPLGSPTKHRFSDGTMSCAPKPGTFVNRTVWRWLGSTRRHELIFDHDSMTGSQRLWVDDAEVYKQGWKFRLTGDLHIPVDDANVQLQISSDQWGTLVYTLRVDSKIVPYVDEVASTGAAAASGGDAASSKVTSWRVPIAGSIVTIEYNHATLDILVDGVRTEAEGSFGEENEDHAGGSSVGASHSFLIPPRLEDTAVITLGAHTAKGASAALTVNGTAIVPINCSRGSN